MAQGPFHHLHLLLLHLHMAQQTNSVTTARNSCSATWVFLTMATTIPVTSERQVTASSFRPSLFPLHSTTAATRAARAEHGQRDRRPPLPPAPPPLPRPHFPRCCSRQTSKCASPCSTGWPQDSKTSTWTCYRRTSWTCWSATRTPTGSLKTTLWLWQEGLPVTMMMTAATSNSSSPSPRRRLPSGLGGPCR